MKNRVFGSFVISFLLLMTSSVSAQHVFPTPSPSPPPPKPTPTPPAVAPLPPPCPTVSVQSQAGRRGLHDGEPVAFSVNIAGGDPKVAPTIIWNTSAGTIKTGQGTRRIEVDTTGAGSSDRELKADVWVGGYAPQCLVQASGSVQIIAPATKFGDFGVVDDKTLKRNLDALSTFLSQSPDNLFLIGYAGRNSERGFTADWLRRMKEALVTAGISPRRIAAVDGGYREEPLFDFWIVPRGAEPPRPKPTLKASDIVPPKTKPGGKP